MKILRSPDPNKAHGRDMINIYMVKIYHESICKPLQMLFCIENCTVPNKSKNTTKRSSHSQKKMARTKIQRFVSLPPIYGTIK